MIESADDADHNPEPDGALFVRRDKIAGCEALGDVPLPAFRGKTIVAECRRLQAIEPHIVADKDVLILTALYSLTCGQLLARIVELEAQHGKHA